MEQDRGPLFSTKTDKKFSIPTPWDVASLAPQNAVNDFSSQQTVISRRQLLFGAGILAVGLVAGCSPEKPIQPQPAEQNYPEVNLRGIMNAGTVEVIHADRYGNLLGKGTGSVGFDAESQNFGLFTVAHVIVRTEPGRFGTVRRFDPDDHILFHVPGFENGVREFVLRAGDVNTYGVNIAQKDPSVSFALSQPILDELKTADLVPFYRMPTPKNLQVGRIVAAPVVARRTFTLALIERIRKEVINTRMLCRDACSGQSGTTVMLCRNNPECRPDSKVVPVLTNITHNPVSVGEIRSISAVYAPTPDNKSYVCSDLMEVVRPLQ